jgi:hypothetical protein
MSPRAVLFALIFTSACSTDGGAPLPKNGRVGGELRLSPDSRGDAFLFLYPRTTSGPQETLSPKYITAVPGARLAAGDSRYVFGAVPPNPYRLWAFLDVDKTFDPDIDVLAQPGAGDRMAEFAELNLQPGEHLAIDVAIKLPVANEPPAFRLEGELPKVLEIADQTATVQYTLLPQPLGGKLSKEHLAFRVSLVDENGDGKADDENQDGVPDLYPQIFLRFLPRPGQVVPLDPKGKPATVVIPFAFNPAPFLTLLSGDVKMEIAVDRLQILLLPQAQAITWEAGLGRQIRSIAAMPVGDYELVAVAKTGQYWRIPNGLGPSWPDQDVHFRVVHGTQGIDAGFPRFDGGFTFPDGGFRFDAGP